MPQVTQDLLANVSILALIPVVYAVLMVVLRSYPVGRQLAFGAALGVFAIIVMMLPYRVEEGVFYDARSVVLGVGAIAGGPVPAVIAASVAIGGRVALGGAGLLPGILSILAASLLPLVYRWTVRRRSERKECNLGDLFAMAVLAHAGVVAAQLLLPPAFWAVIFPQTVAWLFLIGTIATFLLSWVIQTVEGSDRDRARLDSALKQLESMVSVLDVGTWTWARDGNAVYWNDRMYRQLGLSPKSIEPSFDAFLARVHPDDRAVLVREWNRARREGGDAIAQFRVVTSGGGMRWMRGSGSFERNSTGGATGHGVLVDISEQRNADHIRRGSVSQIVNALAKVVEVRDPYTAGHQRRVAEISDRIARKMGLAESRREGLVIAASIHDIGKLHVPIEILNKSGRLSPAEFELVKSHVTIGYQLLKDIDFPWPVAEMIRDHHERLDGSGYPNRAKAGSILTEARIIAVADTLEAMAAHRPYRPGLGLDAAMAQLHEDREIKLDANVVAACDALYRDGTLHRIMAEDEESLPKVAPVVV